MQLFGYELSFRKAAPLRPLSSGRDGWWPIIHEPYTGAWQLNDSISVEAALTHPSVFAVVTGIAADCSKIAPPLLLERDDDGFWHETVNSAYSPVLMRPNRYQNPQQFAEQWFLSKLITGNTYALKNRDDRGVVNAAYILDPARVKVLIAPDGSVYYELQPNDLAGIAADTPPVVVPQREVFHDRWNCLYHPMIGVPPLSALTGPLTQAGLIQESRTTFFAKGGRPGGVLIAPTKLDPLSAQRIKADIANLKAGDILLGEFGMTWEPSTTTAVDAQIIQQLGWTDEKIASAYHHPISLLDSSKQPPYANAEASQLDYKSRTLEQHLVSFARVLGDGLDLPSYLKLEFDDTLLIWMDTTTRVNAAKTALSAGLSPNEVRDVYHGYGPVPGGELPYLQQQYEPMATRAAAAAADAPPSEEAVAAAVGDLAEP